MTDQLRISNQDFSLNLIRIENQSSLESLFFSGRSDKRHYAREYLDRSPIPIFQPMGLQPSFKELPTTQTSIDLVPEKFQCQTSVSILDNYLSPDFRENQNEQIRLFQNTNTISSSEESLLLQDLEPDWLPYVETKKSLCLFEQSSNFGVQKNQNIILDSQKKSQDFLFDDIEEKKMVQLRQRCYSLDIKSPQLHQYTQNQFKSLKNYREPEFITIKIEENKKSQQKNLCMDKIRQRKFTIDTQITENLQISEEKSFIRQKNLLVSLHLDSQKLDQSLLLSQEQDFYDYLTEQKKSRKGHKKCDISQNIPHTFNQIKNYFVGLVIVENQKQQSQRNQFLDPQFVQICKKQLLQSEQRFNVKENLNQSQLKKEVQKIPSKVQKIHKTEEGKQKVLTIKTSSENLNETVSKQRTLQKFKSTKQSQNFKYLDRKQINRVGKTTKTQKNKSVEKEKEQSFKVENKKTSKSEINENNINRKQSFKAKEQKVRSQTVIDSSQTNQTNDMIDLIQMKHENLKKCQKNIKQIDVQTELFASDQLIELEKALEQNYQLKLKVKSQQILRQGLELKFCRLSVEMQRIKVQIAMQQLQNENIRLKLEMKENQNIKLLIKDRKLTQDLETMNAKISALQSQKISFIRSAEETNKIYINCLKENSAYIYQIEGLKKSLISQQRSLKFLQTQFKRQKLKINQQSQQVEKVLQLLKKLNYQSDKLKDSNQIISKQVISLTQYKQNLKQGLDLRHQEILSCVKYLRNPMFKMRKARRYVENNFNAEKNSVIIFKDKKNISDILNKMRQIQQHHFLLKESIFLKNIQQTYAIDLIQQKINSVNQINSPILKLKILFNQNYYQEQILKPQQNQNLLSLCNEKNIQPLPIKLSQSRISEPFVKPIWNQVQLYDYDWTQQKDELYQSNLQMQSQISSGHRIFRQQSNLQYLPNQFRSQLRIQDENSNSLYQLSQNFSEIFSFLDRFFIFLQNKIRFNFYN